MKFRSKYAKAFEYMNSEEITSLNLKSVWALTDEISKRAIGKSSLTFRLGVILGFYPSFFIGFIVGFIQGTLRGLAERRLLRKIRHEVARKQRKASEN